MSKIIATIVILLTFNGCTGKNLVKKSNQESAFIILKTPTMRYADMGFIYKGDSFVKVEIYSMGQPIMSLDINGMNVCMSTFKCMDKKDFNSKILVSSYPDTLLENIFQSKPIFNGKNLIKNNQGFVQNIKSNEYDIHYTVSPKETKFKDIKNKIVIKIKKTIEI
ncbi:MAG: hypothetical protein GXO60_09225 [Epsilonproteobacteria bacterium]|nr:hypothetical protein [Campylobacterota bacterium]